MWLQTPSLSQGLWGVRRVGFRGGKDNPAFLQTYSNEGLCDLINCPSQLCKQPLSAGKEASAGTRLHHIEQGSQQPHTYAPGADSPYHCPPHPPHSSR